MTVKFFAYLREYTKCKIVDFPYQEDVRKLTLALSETYGDRPVSYTHLTLPTTPYV